MNATTISSKFQIVIPRELREEMALTSGTRLIARREGADIVFSPLPTLSELKAELKGCGSELPTEPERF